MPHDQIIQLIEVVKQNLKPEWLRPAQLEKEWEISPKTQANLRSQGKLPYHRIGNIIKYKRSELDDLLESAKVC